MSKEWFTETLELKRQVRRIFQLEFHQSQKHHHGEKYIYIR